MNHVTDVNEPYPSATALAAATKTHTTQGGFAISTRKLPISKAAAIDALTEKLGIPVPEMIFGDNLVQVAHQPSGWSIAFTAQDALDAVDKSDRNMLKVAYARDWESTRETQTRGIKEVVRPFDWSYSTAYAGTETTTTTTTTTTTDHPSSSSSPPLALRLSAEAVIPIELLKRRDPILFFDEVVLYESELDDNGISLYSAKVRVHEERMLLLCRLFMRLDNVLVRIRDTRVYVDFQTQRVVREYTAKEAGFQDVKKKLHMSGLSPDEVTIAMRNPNQLDPLLGVVDHRTEEVCLAVAPMAT